MEFFINIELQFGGNLRTAQVPFTLPNGFFNRQDLCSDFLQRMTSYWLDQKFAKQMGTIKISKLLHLFFFVMPLNN